MLHRLTSGDSVAFPSETAICHTFLNNTHDQVRLIVVGEKRKPENRGRYPLNLELERKSPYVWKDAPLKPLGPHDAKPCLDDPEFRISRWKQEVQIGDFPASRDGVQKDHAGSSSD